MAELIYIAHPYSCLEGEEREQVVREVAELSLEIMKTGRVPLCPTLMAMNILEYGMNEDKITVGHHQHAFWEAVDEELIKRSNEVWFFSTNGAESSEGMSAEASFVIDEKIDFAMIERKSDGGFFMTQGDKAVDFVNNLASLDKRTLRKEKSTIVFG